MKGFLKQRIREEIRAEEAYKDSDALQTIIDGKRNVGALVNPDLRYLKSLGLEYVKIPSNKHGLYIVYRPEGKKEAIELLNLAEKYDGYFAYNASEEDSRRIGQLLGYVESDIDDYIQRNKR